MRRYAFPAAIALLLVSLALVASADTNQVSKILDDVFGKGYDKRLRPGYGTGKPLKVTLSTYVLDVFNINEETHEFSVNMYLRHHWNDDRLVFTPLPEMKFVRLDSDHAQSLWTPDTFIVNERKMVHHGVKTLQEFTRLAPNGDVLQSARLTVTASCKMSLAYFPFDRQLCSLEIESYAHSADDYAYDWRGSAGVSAEASSLKFRITGVKTTETSVTLSSGNYSRLGLEFFFVRNSTRYVQDIYFPVIVLTIIAFFTLFSGSLLLRVQLSVATMLVMVLFMLLNSSSMPKVSYQTALDFYIFFCATMILNAVVVNFIMYNFHKPNETKIQDVQMRRLNEHDHEDHNGGLIGDQFKDRLYDGSGVVAPELNTKFDEVVYSICQKSKYSLPISFLVINFIYWIVVLAGSSWFPEDFILVETRE